MNLIDKIEETAKTLGELSEDGFYIRNFPVVDPKLLARGERYWELHSIQEKNLEELHNG